ncbi:MAG: alkaline phosphatase [Bacteroidota bacterium]
MMQKCIFKTLTILSVILLLGGCNPQSNDSIQADATKEKPRNIILMIGDGMGISQVHAGMTVSETPLVFEQFRYIGFHITSSASDYVTDSGAGGTALATGTKTTNGSIGVDTSGNPLPSILHLSEQKGLATGLVSTSSILHATPASFIAHQVDRNQYQAIAKDFLDTDIDVFIGGGYNDFKDREDGLNLLDSLRKNGYNIGTTLDETLAMQGEKLAGFTAGRHNPSILKGRGDMLPKATEKAVNMLAAKNAGFFLMVEGSQIDWGGHDNDIDYITSEVIDFSNAVEKALAFAKKNKETLVIVTADHETGGLGLNGGDEQAHTVDAGYTTDYHTGVMVPVFAFGPGAEEFMGIYDNTDVFKKMKKLLIE